jgi:predicted dehydrogenase
MREEALMIRVGIVGAGYIGRVHAEAFRSVEGAQVSAVASRTPQRAEELAAEHGARILPSNEALFADPDVDAVVITYPTPTHAELTIAALEAGKHVLCEKPVAFSLNDADRMGEVWRHSGRTLIIAHCLRFWSGYVELERIAASGELGRPLAASARRQLARPKTGVWDVGEAITGGTVLDVMVHDFDQVNWLLGTPRSVLARGRADANGAVASVLASVRYDHGDAIVEGSAGMPSSFPFNSSLRLICEQGALDYQFAAAGGLPTEGQGANALTLYPPEGEPSRVPLSDRDAYVTQGQYFVDCIREGRAPEQGTLDQARDALRLALAARDSLRTGKEVTL